MNADSPEASRVFLAVLLGSTCVWIMTPSSIPAKKENRALAPLIGVAIFVLIGVAVTGIVEQRSLQTNGSVTSSALLGEWRTADGAARLLFRPDKTLSMSGAAGQSGSEDGEYELQSAGVVLVNLKNGKRFAAHFREFTPNQFDLVDAETQGVRVFAKVSGG